MKWTLLVETECFKIYEIAIDWDLYEVTISKASPPFDYILVLARDNNLNYKSNLDQVEGSIKMELNG